MLSRRQFISASAALAICGCRSTAARTFVIGGVLPLTGDGSSYGAAASNGARLAIDLFNASTEGRGSAVRWQVEDSRGDPVSAASAARKLIDVNGAGALIGDVTSAGTHAILPIATRARIPLISPAASDPALSGASPFFARVWPSDLFEAGVIGRHAAERGYRAIGVLYSNDDYGAGFARAFRNAVGNRIAFEAAFPVNSSDFRPLVRRLSAQNADAVLIVALPERAGLILRQMAEARLTLPVLATASIEDPQIASLSNAGSIVFASPAPVDATSVTRRQFEAEYRRAYHADPGVLADTGYDAARLLIEAHRANPDPAAVMAWIKTQRNYDGASGRMSFAPSGDVEKEYRLKGGRAGGFAWL
jgi:branched-chain amino acid transport system substrate-binding protein